MQGGALDIYPDRATAATDLLKNGIQSLGRGSSQAHTRRWACLPARAAGLLALERAAEKNRASGEQAGRSTIAAFSVCLMLNSACSVLAECQLRVLKWAPVCSESDVTMRSSLIPF